jgi:hypothetical protein
VKSQRLPKVFCWTRFGTEASESIEAILRRKEQERISNDGLFLWGIGNAIGPSIVELIERALTPEVLFSPIKSAPKCKDVTPAAIATWTSAFGLDGSPFDLPTHSLVTSRYDVSAPKRSHYALVCFRDMPLTLSRSEEKLLFSGLRNLRTGRPVGASQVTAVVERLESQCSDLTPYEVAIRAALVPPYFIRLADPVWHTLHCPTSSVVTIESRLNKIAPPDPAFQ